MIIDDRGEFDGVITGPAIGAHLASTDLIDLTQLPYVGGSMSVSVSYNTGTNLSTMTFSDGISANNVTLHLSGNYAGTAWSFTSINGGAGTEIYDPPADSANAISGATGEVPAASATQVVSMGAVGTLGDSFHFNDENSYSKGSRVIDLAELNDTQTSMSHREDAAAAHGPLAILGGGETPGTPADSFHFRDEIFTFKGPGLCDVAELQQIPTSIAHHDNSVVTHTAPVIPDGPIAIELPALEQHLDDPFNIAPGHAPSALVTHMSHDLMV